MIRIVEFRCILNKLAIFFRQRRCQEKNDTQSISVSGINWVIILKIRTLQRMAYGYCNQVNFELNVLLYNSQSLHEFAKLEFAVHKRGLSLNLNFAE